MENWNDDLQQMLKEKPLNKITVKEICALAEINRATFYKYYADAYDLMDKIEDALLKELQETVQHSLKDGINKTLVQILEKMKFVVLLDFRLSLFHRHVVLLRLEFLL